MGSPFSLRSSSPHNSRREPPLTSGTYFYFFMSRHPSTYTPVNHQRKSTRGNTKHQSSPAAWLLPLSTTGPLMEGALLPVCWLSGGITTTEAVVFQYESPMPIMDCHDQTASQSVTPDSGQSSLILSSTPAWQLSHRAQNRHPWTSHMAMMTIRGIISTSLIYKHEGGFILILRILLGLKTD